MLDRRDDGAPAPVPVGGLPTFVPATSSDEGDGFGALPAVVSFLVTLTLSIAVASALAGSARRRFTLFTVALGFPGVAMGVLTLAVGSLFGRGPA